MGYADLSYTGAKDYSTPNIDKLASSGVRFTDAHTTGNVCAPSRASLLTGSYQNRFGFTLNGDSLPEGTHMLANDFKDAGYQTFAVGKWHLGPNPLTVGFDHFTGFLSGHRTYFPKPDITAYERMMRDGVDIETSGWKYTTDFLTDEGLQMIKNRDSKKPFFLFLSYNAVHTPIEAPKELLDKFAHISDKSRQGYAAMTTSLDDNIGRVLKYLESNGLRKNTMVVFLSDNGGATNNGSDNGEWRGMKGSYWEGGHRVPFVISWPAGLKSYEYKLPVFTVDLSPTFLALSGHKPKSTDGVNLLPYLKGEKSGRPHETFCWHMGVSEAVRSGDLMLIRSFEDDGSVHGITLFDLAQDPYQKVDLSTTRLKDKDRLITILDKWNAEMPKPMSTQQEIYKNNNRKKHEMSVIGREAERKLP
jgi:arylsulfatase A-like enzyme